MKRLLAAFIFFSCFLCSHSQKVQTIVPKQAVVGNAFQIQYIISNPSNFISISPPSFENLQLISGPNYYKGNSLINGKNQAIENITFTVVPLKVGSIKITPLIARFKNSEDESSDEVRINVVSQPKASFNSFSTYTDINLYAPSSKTDLDKLIEANLFIKTEVDKRVCFLGEAITASFKLYSRLQSTSEVINAPSLYGFSVMDMLNTNEAHQAVETIDGKVFNTSVLRKLQLYPAQTGKLTIDEMQLHNTIEFNDSVTGNKIKVEKQLASNPIDIIVKPLSPKEPLSFTGAVGQFSIRANLQTSKIEANTQDKLVVIISGKGNFIQFGPPTINWPKGFDIFEPVITDELKSSIPTEGERKYIFSFTTGQIGKFTVPAISFSFFDLHAGKYREVSTDSMRLEIVPAPVSKKNKENHPARPSSKSWTIIVAIMLLFAAAIFVWETKNKQKNNQPLPTKKTTHIQKLNEITSLQLTGRQFCSEIQKLLTEVNKEWSLSHEQQAELNSIQSDCQLLIYSAIDSDGKKEELRRRVEILLGQLV